jgi:DNA-binding response OmpR family regulator
MIAATDALARCHPCLILADADEAFAAKVERSFRRLGWDVYTARSGPEARRLARMLEPSLVILDVKLPEESGWLTCDKLTREFASLWVILVDAKPDEQDQRFASFVGARALVDRLDGNAAMLRQAARGELSAAG